MNEVFLKSVSKDGVFRVESEDRNRCNALLIYYEDEVINIHYDHGEPEDNSFARGYMWIVDALVDAYNYGLENGRIDGYEEGYAAAFKDMHDDSGLEAILKEKK